MTGQAEQPYAIVVDPLGTGQDYPLAFQDAGVRTVAVLSTPEPIAPFRSSWHPERFAAVHVYQGDLAELAATLRAYHPLCLITGSETGVELADALVELVLPDTGNVPVAPGQASPRRDKWAMTQAIQRAGLPHVRQICSADPEEIDDWLRRTGLADGRLVVKPPKSGGTDDVHFVAPGQDWRPFFHQIHGKVNTLGVRNDAVIVAEYVQGTEYMLDSYSVDGKHGLVDVCRYVKSQRGDRIGIYDLVEFLPPEHEAIGEAWAYTQRVLDAVGIRNGCAHAEVMMTADGPRLVEVAARPAGGGHQMITELATGSNHILRTVDHLVRGEFHESYQLIRYVCSVVINSPAAGVWRNPELFADVESLSTYWAKHFAGVDGTPVPQTVDFVTYLGWVVLASPDHAAVRADYRRLKELERQIVIEPVDTGE